MSAKANGARFRTGPELEVTGYGCEDHFYETDTTMHSWQTICNMLSSDVSDGCIVDVGMPVRHRSVLYNCRVVILNRRIVLVRPKSALADDGNYRESRWFTAWNNTAVDQYVLPQSVRAVTGQTAVPFGIILLQCSDGVIGWETCEELFTPNSPHIAATLNGADVIANGSGSHHTLRKLVDRLDLIQSATAKCGGAYLYANQRGCDGNRLYYDGSALVVLNGAVIAQSQQFSVSDIEVLTAVVDLNAVESFRQQTSSRNKQAANCPRLPVVTVEFDLCSPTSAVMSSPITATILSSDNELCYGPACWLWDYLRRSGASGFFLPLSGGADSAAVAAIVGSMCQIVVKAAATDQTVADDVRRICAVDDIASVTHQSLANLLLHTAYIRTANNSSATADRARSLASDIGAYHSAVSIDPVIDAIMTVFSALTGRRPRFRSDGGSDAENLACQNVAARIRMVISYLFAALLPWCRGRRGWLLVLATANVDEALRGYMTKYDCSSGDINPIGAVSKTDIKKFLAFACGHLGYKTLDDIRNATPTAELEPITADYTQSDEADMKMSYNELSVYGRLRMIDKCGPFGMFQRLTDMWTHLSAEVIGSKVKDFFFYYAVNRHKMAVLTPAYHAEKYSPDDHRYDHRQLVYNTKWTRQFASIDDQIAAIRRRSRM